MSETPLTTTTEKVKAIPTQLHERVQFVDVLRGFALFGVLAFNMIGLSGEPHGLQAWSDPIDRAVFLLRDFLVQAKFYSLFSFLFGWGMALQMLRAQRRGTPFATLFVRRLIILLILGILHGTLLWRGDILTSYALLGFLLLLFRNRSERSILIGSLLALCFAMIMVLPGQAMDSFRNGYEAWRTSLPFRYPAESIFATGSWLQIIKAQAHDYAIGLTGLIYAAGNIFGMFLLGLYVGRRRIFERVETHLSLLRRVGGAGLLVGILFNGLFVATTIWSANDSWPIWIPTAYRWLVAVGSRTIGAPSLMLFYVCGIIMLVRKERWSQQLAPLANLGRMSLTNYMLQSIIGALIFYNYGLGLFGETSPTFNLILTLLIYLGQIRLSRWWLERYQFGPMEWVWRSLTYGRFQSMAQGATNEVLQTSPPFVRSQSFGRLVAVWIALLLWAAALGYGYANLNQAVRQISLDPDQASLISLPGSVSRSGEQEPESFIIATPAIQPVAYHPGAIVASGDLLALAETFDANQALQQIEILAGEAYNGRLAGSPSGWAAGEYIAAQFAAYGLQPAGDDGTFFQSFPIEYIDLAQVPTLTIEGPDQTIYDQYELYDDFAVVVAAYMGAGVADGQVVWVNHCSHDDFGALNLVDKIIFCQPDAIGEASRNAIEHGAAGLLFLIDPETRPLDRKGPFQSLWLPAPLAIPTLLVSPAVAADLIRGSGKTVSELSLSFSSFPMATRARIEVNTVGAEACPGQQCLGRNVLGVLPGRDPGYADELLIIGGHYDHMGRAPNGRVWPGANDNASGIATLIEIARSWHTQGYVPQRTVLFAAWDAEELGLVGSSYYVTHPRYPLSNTVGSIQLDMVGAGEDQLYIDGEGGLAARLEAAATSLGVETLLSNYGRSDHTPFAAAGVPSNLLIWFGGNSEFVPHYHRPIDTPEVIELGKLEVTAKIASLVAFSLIEAEPLIEDLLLQRAAAIEQGDLAAFLQTGLSDRSEGERAWFADVVENYSPITVTLQATDLHMTGRKAGATVQMILSHLDGNDVTGPIETTSINLAAQFEHSTTGWRWAGAELDPVPSLSAENFVVVAPAEHAASLGGLAAVVSERYAAMASLLGLPGRPNARLSLYPTVDSLRADTSLSLPNDTLSWVGPGEIKLVYSSQITESARLNAALSQLMIAEAGGTEAAAPWLWHGLPAAVATDGDLESAHTTYLPKLYQTLTEATFSPNEATYWAAVDYLQQRIGWDSLGRFINDLGNACRRGRCDDASGLDEALDNALGLDVIAFESSWKLDWRRRLQEGEAAIAAVLSARAEAVLSRNVTAFLQTVADTVPNLLMEEQHWFDNLTLYPAQSFTYSALPLVLYPDGAILAEITMVYELSGLNPGPRGDSVQLPILFTPAGNALRWAGTPFELLAGQRVDVLYARGQGELAQVLLTQAEAVYPEIARELQMDQPVKATIKLYSNASSYRASIFLSWPTAAWLSGWTGDDESTKLWLDSQGDARDYYPILVEQLTRSLLHQLGVQEAWLLKGAAVYALTNLAGDNATRQSVTSYLRDVLFDIRKERLPGLSEMRPEYELTEDEWLVATSQAWDAVRYLEISYGFDALLGLLKAQGGGLTSDEALRTIAGQSLADFEASWSESLAQGHTLPEWSDIAASFDVGQALEHINFLTTPELAGRQAGSPGSDAAAAYIAEAFAQYGLLPAGSISGTTYLQQFPIQYATLWNTPYLQFTLPSAEEVPFVYHEDFITAINPSTSGRPASGELVYVQDESYSGLDLSGKIVLRHDNNPVELEAARAFEHGANGLVLIGQLGSTKDFLIKHAMPVTFTQEATIPVLVLTQPGFMRLLEIGGLTQADLNNAPPALSLGIQAQMQIPLSSPAPGKATNVLGLLPGSDPVLNREFIILGAHYDYVGYDPDTLSCTAGLISELRQFNEDSCQRLPGLAYSGANDDASGVALLLEIARLWHETGYRPESSILFAAWGAQEAGEIGSQYYVENPTYPLTDTIGMMQVDAVGGGKGARLLAQGRWGSEGQMLFGIDMAAEILDGRLQITVPTGQSDHLSFRDAGIPSLLITWTDASEENWPDTIADEIEPQRLGASGSLVTLALMTITR